MNMPERREKLCNLAEAAALVQDGDRVAFGGFSIFQKPMALVHELVRAQKRDLAIVGSVNSIEVDMLVGAGCAKRVETSYVGLEAFGLAPNFRRAVQSGAVQVVHYSEMMAWDRFRANWEALPYWPAYYLGGSDLAARNPDIVPYTCPVTGKPAWAVPAANPDVVVLHAAKADKWGNVAMPAHHMLPQSMDHTMSRAGGKLIITAEEIADTEEFKKAPHLTFIPAFRTACVVHVPGGSHPTATLTKTKTDAEHFAAYAQAAAKEEAFDAYLREYVYGVSSFAEYYAKSGAAQRDLREEGAL